MNTLEWLPIFLPSLWLFAIYVSDAIAAAIELVWIIGRIVYMVRLHQVRPAAQPRFCDPVADRRRALDRRDRRDSLADGAWIRTSSRSSEARAGVCRVIYR